MFRKRVIIADSSQSLLEGIRGLLETVFDIVTMVADVESLIDAVEKLSADMVVIDLSIDSMHETGAVTTIKREFPGLKVLVISGHDETVAKKRAMEAGADGFVLKRDAARDLLPAVEKILDGGKYSSALQNG